MFIRSCVILEKNIHCMMELKEEVNGDLTCVDRSGAPMCLACVAGVGGERVGKKNGEVN